VQTLDMNQDAWFEECLKLPNALKMLTVKPATGRPVAVVGLREHIFTHCLSSSAYFMSQQEYLFGTMWQRLMASPLRVRFHYGAS
jgi:callose synthase